MLSDTGNTCTHLPGCQHIHTQAHMENTCWRGSEGVRGWLQVGERGHGEKKEDAEQEKKLVLVRQVLQI